MEIATVEEILSSADTAQPFLLRLGLTDLARGYANLLALRRHGLTPDLLAVVYEQLAAALPSCPDPDMALNNLERFVARARNPLSLGALFERDPDTLPILIRIFSTSQYLSDILAAEPESFELVRASQGMPYPRQVLVDDILAEVSALESEASVLSALRRFKRREILRIAYGDIVCDQSIHTVTAQISYLAEAILEAALYAAYRRLSQHYGAPRLADGNRARFVILGMGKLGGVELNYSSDLDLIFFYEDEGHTDGLRRLSNAEFFEQLAGEVIRLLTTPTPLGVAYRVDMRLRPEGKEGPLAMSIPAALWYYDNRGRTWERQAFIKARPVAGDRDLGEHFLRQLTPWIYRRFLSRADISGIKALKRRIEQQTRSCGAESTNVKTGRGGIRDIEFVIQFLQLLNGPDLPTVRTGNTLEAIAQLAAVGCLTEQERAILSDNYCFLRKLEHRLQIMLDLQTHTLPSDAVALRRLARRMGYVDTPEADALEQFLADYRRRTEENHRVLNHLLHHAFSDDTETEAEVDLVLDPNPSWEQIHAVLGKYGFKNIPEAYRNLMSLSEERVRFLSTRRTRHFLASIAPQLLRAIAETPDPDATLVNLDRVTGSLGGRGVLWELFSFNPPSLRLFVELCAYSPYLSEILTSNPGMIDSLLDSLVLDKLPTRDWLRQSLGELCFAAEELDPILNAFKNDQILRVGVRDLLGKEDVIACCQALSDVAEVILEQVVAAEFTKLRRRYGVPLPEGASSADQPAELVVLAMGKFGGAELTYRSDLDIVFLYDRDGSTVPGDFINREGSLANSLFFTELAQQVIHRMNRLTPYGRLYEVDMRLRPIGASGPLVTSFGEFRDYYAGRHCQFWERMALCRARPVYVSARLRPEVERLLRECILAQPWRDAMLGEIRHMRQRLEETAGDGNLKRGKGGAADVEFIVQTLQLRYGANYPEILCPHILQAIEQLVTRGLLSQEAGSALAENYRFLRRLESRIRLVNPVARNRLPTDLADLARIAHLMNFPGPNALLERYREVTADTRRRFEEFFKG
ncbi:MAG: bifunctional [glutamate--ammonia ligase]-adenylyl-L-tyrosine phosphorylase/[glutamate--ammonia-ligase] adenylyltransferase [Thermoguttaceae bacterium]|nr:bifunctional [glutamate--ammonia ligase]-adenylyl-L-tyrosine phosphorylase/[glutamate--ammonia-ligase] adenylyltransferase [Thermoguttaceae bacterium]MDW8077881.1 bifunctional [glutamate--ammonia ligase]-adenylyl-L-tyrosine phosphorylase/[glutamate--ammonia-ligase] adenylyltransferase [Thermoguttaceae bacterium]